VGSETRPPADLEEQWRRRRVRRAGWGTIMNAVCERCRTVGEAAAVCEGCGEQLCGSCWGEGEYLLCGVCRHRRRPAFEDVVVTSRVL